LKAREPEEWQKSNASPKKKKDKGNRWKNPVVGGGPAKIERKRENRDNGGQLEARLPEIVSFFCKVFC